MLLALLGRVSIVKDGVSYADSDGFPGQPFFEALTGIIIPLEADQC